MYPSLTEVSGSDRLKGANFTFINIITEKENDIYLNGYTFVMNVTGRCLWCFIVLARGYIEWWRGQVLESRENSTRLWIDLLTVEQSVGGRRVVHKAIRTRENVGSIVVFCVQLQGNNSCGCSDTPGYNVCELTFEKDHLIRR